MTLRRFILMFACAAALLGGKPAFALNFSELLGGKSDLTQVQDSDMIYGDPKAPVTIIEYASLTCPHCANFHNKVFPELAKTYIDSGKVRLVNRPFPLNEPALKAAQLATCAGKDRYFTFIKVLYETLERWAFGDDYMNNLAQIAKVGGFSEAEFNACMMNKDIEKSILLSRKNASDQLGVNSTPTFFINGKKLEGEQTIEAFKAAIDPLLPASAPAR